MPGTQGDTLKVVQNLPGVARAALGSGALIVWGAAPADTRVYVDGVGSRRSITAAGCARRSTRDLVRVDRPRARRLRRRVRPRPRRPGQRRDARRCHETACTATRRPTSRRLGDDLTAPHRAERRASPSPGATATSIASSPASRRRTSAALPHPALRRRPGDDRTRPRARTRRSSLRPRRPTTGSPSRSRRRRSRAEVRTENNDSTSIAASSATAPLPDGASFVCHALDWPRRHLVVELRGRPGADARRLRRTSTALRAG